MTITTANMFAIIYTFRLHLLPYIFRPHHNYTYFEYHLKYTQAPKLQTYLHFKMGFNLYANIIV